METVNHIAIFKKGLQRVLIGGTISIIHFVFIILAFSILGLVLIGVYWSIVKLGLLPPPISENWIFNLGPIGLAIFVLFGIRQTYNLGKK